MELPLTLKFFKKLEFYQDLKRLDKIATEQQKTGRDKCAWHIEKKVLRWTYSGHKHLGSPLFMQHFFEEKEAAKRHFLYCFDKWAQEHKNELKELMMLCLDVNKKQTQLNEMNKWRVENVKKLLKDIEKQFIILPDSNKKRLNIEECPFDYNFSEEISKVPGDCFKSFCLSGDEKLYAKKDVRNILKNLVARGFARFSNEKDEEDGVIISEKGLLMGEVIWETTIIDSDSLLKEFNAAWLFKSWIIIGWATIFFAIWLAVLTILEKIGLLDNLIASLKSTILVTTIVQFFNSYSGIIFIILFLAILILTILSYSNILLRKHE